MCAGGLACAKQRIYRLQGMGDHYSLYSCAFARLLSLPSSYVRPAPLPDSLLPQPPETVVMLVVACAVYRRRRRKRVSSGNNGVEMTSRDDLLDPAHDSSHDPALEEGHDQPADVLELHAVKPASQKTWARNGE